MIITVLSSHRKSIYQKKNVSNNRITLFVDDLNPLLAVWAEETCGE